MARRAGGWSGSRRRVGRANTPPGWRYCDSPKAPPICCRCWTRSARSSKRRTGWRRRGSTRRRRTRRCTGRWEADNLQGMTRYAAFLRGVMPTNAKMPEVKKAFEATGFTDVKTVLASGNVVFTARAASEPALQQKIEAALLRRCGTAFLTIVRPVDALRQLLASDPWRAFRIDPAAKRIVTFLREKPATK